MNKYDIIKTLGEGGQGVVYLAKDVVTNETVAIKKSSRSYSNQNEIEALQRLKASCNKDYIICYRESFSDAAFNYIVMEYFEGYDLFELIDGGYRPSDDEVVKVAKRLFKALNAMHTLNVVHRDIKIENILFNQHTMKLKIIDLGLSCVDTCDPWSRYGTLTMFPPEFPPCKKQPSRPISFEGFEKADVFAAGLVLYEFASGDILDDCPFTNEQILSAEDGEYEMPEHVDLGSIRTMPSAMSIITACLIPDPYDRPSAEEVLDIIEGYF